MYGPIFGLKLPFFGQFEGYFFTCLRRLFLSNEKADNYNLLHAPGTNVGLHNHVLHDRIQGRPAGWWPVRTFVKMVYFSYENRV